MLQGSLVAVQEIHIGLIGFPEIQFVIHPVFDHSGQIEVPAQREAEFLGLFLYLVFKIGVQFVAKAQILQAVFQKFKVLDIYKCAV